MFDRLRLTTRLLVFFLALLATVLAAFDTALYLVVRSHLHHQIDSRLEGTIAALAAVAEVDSHGFEWEPQDRSIAFGIGADADQVRWLVHNGSGRELGRSENLRGMADWKTTMVASSLNDVAIRELEWNGEPWRLSERVLSMPGPQLVDNSPADAKEGDRHASLVLSAGLPLSPVIASLRQLFWILTGLSGAIWIACAVSGRFLCRRALAPLLKMAADTGQISTSHLSARLSNPDTGDELATLADSFNALLARFQEAFERQQRFTADASHQLRTPLAVMLGQIDVALRRDRPPEEYHRVLELLRRRVLELQQMTEMLLLLARSEKDAQILECVPVDLRTLLPDIVAHGTGTAGRAPVQLEIAPETPLPVSVHQSLFTQAIDNLLDNAARYSPAGAPILVSAQRQGDRVLIAVEDQGPGIAADELPHVFQSFFRGAAGRQNGHAGAGLGLAVVKQITEAFSGTIEVKSPPGRGARFVIALPCTGSAAGAVRNAEFASENTPCSLPPSAGEGLGMGGISCLTPQKHPHPRPLPHPGGGEI